MVLRLVFLGRLEDVAGAGEIALPLTGPLPLASVLTMLPDNLAKALGGAKIKLALNGALLPPGAAPVLKAGDELAFLPPVSGG